MSCRITGKICDAWSDVAGCGLVRCKFVEKKDGGEILNDETVTDRHQMTNADRIRAMTDEELAGFMRSMMDCVSCEKTFSFKCDGNYNQCLPVCLGWLQQPAEEDGHD